MRPSVLFIAIAALFALIAASASAAEVHVTSEFDNTPGSLREAIAAANPGDTVVIDPGVGPIVEPPTIAIDKSLTIRGQGAAATRIGMSGSGRIFKIGFAEPVIAVTIEGVRLVGGHAPDGEPGLNENPIGPTPPTGGDVGAAGGAIANMAHQVSLAGVELSGNSAGEGGTGGSAFGVTFFPGAGGAGGSGGAIWNKGTMQIVRSTLVNNFAGNGGSAGAGTTFTSPGGAGGSGGAIANEGTMAISESTISGNFAGSGSAAGFGITLSSPGAAGGNGGAILDTGTLSIERSTLSGNAAGAGGTGGGGTTIPGGGGAGGSGGAVFVEMESAELTNDTLVGNAAGAGGAGGSGSTIGGAGGSGGAGGAVAGALGTTTKIAAATVTGNSAGAGGSGGSGSPTPGAAGAAGAGGGLSSAGAMTVGGSVLAANSGAPANCGLGVLGVGVDVAFPEAGGCAAFAVGDPKLDPAGLASNGGPTQTIALGAGSAAIDAVPSTACLDADGAPLTIDQRGIGRPIGSACDAGAFEAASVKTPLPKPDTKIRGKAHRTVRTAKKRAKVKIAFSSVPAGASFECKLDKGRYKRCSSPKLYRLKPGRHTIRVRAVLDGVADPTPARVTIKVIHRHT